MVLSDVIIKDGKNGIEFILDGKDKGRLVADTLFLDTDEKINAPFTAPSINIGLKTPACLKML
jgi:hypothetical protein